MASSRTNRAKMAPNMIKVHSFDALSVAQKGSLKVRHLIRAIFSLILLILVAVIELQTGGNEIKAYI